MAEDAPKVGRHACPIQHSCGCSFQKLARMTCRETLRHRAKEINRHGLFNVEVYNKEVNQRLQENPNRNTLMCHSLSVAIHKPSKCFLTCPNGLLRTVWVQYGGVQLRSRPLCLQRAAQFPLTEEGLLHHFSSASPAALQHLSLPLKLTYLPACIHALAALRPEGGLIYISHRTESITPLYTMAHCICGTHRHSRCIKMGARRGRLLLAGNNAFLHCTMSPPLPVTVHCSCTVDGGGDDTHKCVSSFGERGDREGKHPRPGGQRPGK